MLINRSTVEIPKQMLHLPVWNGFPIPYTTMMNGDVPDFRTLNHLNVLKCIYDRKCAVCGNPIPQGWLAFIGGQLSAQSRMYIDPAMHKECAYYAAQVCPYLAGTKREYATSPNKSEMNPEVTHVVHIEQTRPKRMALYLTTGYDVVPDGQQILCRAFNKPAKIDWDIMPESR